MRRPELIARQGRCPSGILGNVIARIMARETAQSNRQAVELLNLQPTDRVLEVGFGHGQTVAAILTRVPDGSVSGVDLSPDMVRMAQRVNRLAVAKSRADLRLGASENLPFEDGSFDKALAVHTIYFWDDLRPHLAGIFRVLRPGGLLVLGFRSIDASALAEFPQSTHHFRDTQEVIDALCQAGFSDPRVTGSSPSAKSHVIFVEAEKKSCE